MRLIDADLLQTALMDEYVGIAGYNTRAQFYRAIEIVQQQPTITQPPNAPLPLEELLEMDGEPVYDWMGYEWFVVSEVTDDEVIMTDGTVFDIDEDSVNSAVGRFYRRKPEEGEL